MWADGVHYHCLGPKMTLRFRTRATCQAAMRQEFVVHTLYVIYIFTLALNMHVTDPFKLSARYVYVYT